MSSTKVNGKEMLSLQIKSLLVFEFLNTYNVFEKLVRDIFEKNIEKISPQALQRLYFYYGGKIGTYLEYEGQTIKLENIQYKENEKFRKLSINQIVKIFKADPCIDDFNFQVKSIQRASTVYPFMDCTLNILNMRNILAHEVINCTFKNKDLIELLSIENIKKERFDLLINYDISNMDNVSQHIASNIIYMRKLIESLKLKLFELEETK